MSALLTWRTGRWLVAVALLGAAIVAGAAAWTWRQAHQPFGTAGSVLVQVEPGTPVVKILETLESRGVISSALLARGYLRLGHPEAPLRSGEYEFELPIALPDALEKMIEGRVVLYRVTVIEGLTREETAAHLATEGFGDEARFLALMNDPAPIADLDDTAPHLEGYLFPDTYSFPRGATEEQIVAAMVAGFRKAYASAVEDLDASESSAKHIVTLASIVEKEAQLASERRTVAGVYANRLRIGMGLYADPTVIYALKEKGVWDGNIRRRDLKMESPYNTYLVPGLPPTPIASPGAASLRAAADPEEHDFLYFVSRNDGSHVFAETLREHNRNVEVWQRQYWRDRWARERAAAADQQP